MNETEAGAEADGERIHIMIFEGEVVACNEHVFM